jgi:hypothetical protein
MSAELLSTFRITSSGGICSGGTSMVTPVMMSDVAAPPPACSRPRPQAPSWPPAPCGVTTSTCCGPHSRAAAGRSELLPVLPLLLLLLLLPLLLLSTTWKYTRMRGMLSSSSDTAPPALLLLLLVLLLQPLPSQPPPLLLLLLLLSPSTSPRASSCRRRRLGRGGDVPPEHCTSPTLIALGGTLSALAYASCTVCRKRIRPCVRVRVCACACACVYGCVSHSSSSSSQGAG